MTIDAVDLLAVALGLAGPPVRVAWFLLVVRVRLRRATN